jgi:hypothetical protein
MVNVIVRQSLRGASESGAVSLLASAAAISSTTALVFSLVRGRTIIAASACNAPLSLS